VKTLTLALLLFVPAGIRAADGDLDPSFGDAGVAYVETALLDLAAAVASDGAGNLVVAFSPPGGSASSVFVVARFTPDGQLDPTFDGDGIRAVGFTFGGATRNFARDVALLPDGRIVVAGYARDAASTSYAGALVRLMPNGALDSTLDGDGILVLAPTGQNHRFDELALRPNGNMVVAGKYDDTVNDSVSSVVEFTPSGVTAGFAAVDLYPSQDEAAIGLLLEPDGKMVVGALAFNVTEVVVMRLTPSYTLDTTFGGDGIGHYDWEDPVWAADLDRLEDGRYVLGVQGDLFTGFRWLQPNGAADPTTCTTSPFPFCVITGFLHFSALTAQSDGKVLAIGSSDPGFDVRVIRLQANSAVDNTFGSGAIRDFDCEPGAATSDDGGAALTLSGGRPVGLGTRGGGAAVDGVCLARLAGALIFRSGFESGVGWGWAGSSP